MLLEEPPTSIKTTMEANVIYFKSKGNFKKTTGYFEKIKESVGIGLLDKYGKLGVKALKEYTPKDTGLTASSWYYSIEHAKGRATLSFHNSNEVDHVNIAIILQYGHATKNGGWVEGFDYINPALKPIFENLAQDAWKEVVTI